MKGLHWTGIEVACLREAMLLGVDEFGHTIGCSPRSVRLWESKGSRAQLNPSSKRLLESTYANLNDPARQRFEAALEQVGRLPAATREPTRRIHISASPQQGDLLATFDGLRLVVDQTLSRCTVTPARVELIEERVADRIRTYTTTPPAVALAEIAPGLLELQAISAERQPAAVQARLSESSAVLGLLTADALMKLGEIGRANTWFMTARMAADDSSNRQLQAAARAQHAMLPYYYGDLDKTISLARSAQELLSDTACDATALAAAAEARALARLGDREGAAQAMNKAQRLTEALPNTASEEAFRFSARRLLLYMSGTLTYMGRVTRARRIQDEALQLYQETAVVIDPALIQLDTALGYAMSGSADDGCRLAEHVLESLPGEHLTRIVATRACDVLDALPTGHRLLPSATSLRQLVSAETVVR
jgi:tetratricopeptide (TPR) repeat protein